MQNLRQGRDMGMKNLRQGCDREIQNLRQGRDRGQTIIRSMYNAIVQPRKDIITSSLLAVLLCCLLFMPQLRADYVFPWIRRK